jgi:hypothetical protein
MPHGARRKGTRENTAVASALRLRNACNKLAGFIGGWYSQIFAQQCVKLSERGDRSGVPSALNKQVDIFVRYLLVKRGVGRGLNRRKRCTCVVAG